MTQNLGELTDVIEKHFAREKYDILEVPNDIFNSKRSSDRQPSSAEHHRAIRILELDKDIAETTVFSLSEECSAISRTPRKLKDLLGKKWHNRAICPEAFTEICDEIASEMTKYYLIEIYRVNEEMDASCAEAVCIQFGFIKRLVSKGIESVYEPADGRDKFADFLGNYDGASENAGLYFNWIRNLEEIGRRAESIHFFNIAYRMSEIFHMHSAKWSKDKKFKCLELITDTVDYSIWLCPAHRKHIHPLFYETI